MPTKKTAAKKPAPSSPPAPSTYTATRPLCEDGQVCAKGDTLTLTAERAAALGPLVQPL